MKSKNPVKIKPSEHLELYLKSTPLERLNWIEEVNQIRDRDRQDGHELNQKQARLRTKIKK